MPTAHTGLQVTHIIPSSFFPQSPYWVNDVAAVAEILAQSGICGIAEHQNATNTHVFSIIFYYVSSQRIECCFTEKNYLKLFHSGRKF